MYIHTIKNIDNDNIPIYLAISPCSYQSYWVTALILFCLAVPFYTATGCFCLTLSLDFIISGSAPVGNGVATVTLNGLECGVTYTIIAGGTLNGTLVGPKSSNSTITLSCSAPTDAPDSDDPNTGT